MIVMIIPVPINKVSAGTPQTSPLMTPLHLRHLDNKGSPERYPLTVLDFAIT